MTAPLTILVGTMGGTAEMVADELAHVFRASGRFAPTIQRMERAGLATFEKPGFFVICTSTYGTGDVPDNARRLYAELCDQAPDFDHVRYGVFALGDSHHSATYCFGGAKFDQALQACGAHRIGKVGQHDRHSQVFPEDAGAAWAREWLVAVGEPVTLGDQS